jgi:FAD binding domain in molybdopterin dehydrogenase
MKPAPFDHIPARSAVEALDALARHGDSAKVLAGGQSLVPMLNMRLARPGVVVDINGAGELDYLRETDGTLAVGALVRQGTLERWAMRRVPLIAEALRFVGHTAIRNRGTVAGSIAHADPASELSALLLCLDGAVLAAAGPDDPGVKSTPRDNGPPIRCRSRLRSQSGHGVESRARRRSAPAPCESAARSPHPLRRGHRSGFPSCARRCQYGPWLASPLCGVDRGVLLWGSLCQHVKREASRFIPSTLRSGRTSQRVPMDLPGPL